MEAAPFRAVLLQQSQGGIRLQQLTRQQSERNRPAMRVGRRSWGEEHEGRDVRGAPRSGPGPLDARLDRSPFHKTMPSCSPKLGGEGDPASLIIASIISRVRPHSLSPSRPR